MSDCTVPCDQIVIEKEFYGLISIVIIQFNQV